MTKLAVILAALALGGCTLSDDFADVEHGNKVADARLYRVDKCTVKVMEVRSHMVAGNVPVFEATINTCAPLPTGAIE